MATDSSEQLMQAAIEHEELVRIIQRYLWDELNVASSQRAEDIAHGLIAELAHNNYIWEKVKE